MSTLSRNDDQGKVLRSVHIGAGSMSPASILETKFAQAKASISQRATERRVGRTLASPSSMPPYPAQSPMCVIALVVSTLCCFYWLVAMHEGVEQDCSLHAKPSDGAAGDYLDEED